MPAGLTDFGTEQWLSVLFGIIEPPAQYYVALCSAEPGDEMDGDILADLEPADPDYGRQIYGIGADHWATNDTFITNVLDIDFGLPGLDWGDITHFALCSAPTGGDLYAWGEFLNAQYVLAAYQMSVPAGGLVVTLSTLDNSIAV